MTKYLLNDLCKDAYIHSTRIDVYLYVFKWAFGKTKGVIQLHTQDDVITATFGLTHNSAIALHEVNVMEELICEPGSLYI